MKEDFIGKCPAGEPVWFNGFSKKIAGNACRTSVNGMWTGSPVRAMAAFGCILLAIVLVLSCLPAVSLADGPTTTTIQADADSYARSDSASSNYGTAAYIYARITAPQTLYRGLIRFDLSSIPAGAKIESAKLYGYMYSRSGDRMEAVHRVTGSWTETGVNWNNQPAFDPLTTGVINPGSSINVWLNWDVTQDVQAYMLGAANNGWLLKLDDETTATASHYVYLRSRTYSTSSQRPYLEITYSTDGTPSQFADFTANVSVGTRPLAVQFNDRSTGATSWAWDFDNDGTAESTEQNPVHTYTDSGVYSVSLTVTGASGTDTATKTGCIKAFDLPAADFAASLASGPAPLTVQFTDTSAAVPGILTRAWDFDNDGVTDNTAQNPTFTYALPGNYTVKLTVTNAYGSDIEIKSDYVTAEVPPLPAADFSADPQSGVLPLTVQFTDISTGIITSRAWDLNGDGTTDSTAQNPSFTYFDAGSYTVKLTVSNAGGSVDEVKTGYVAVSEPSDPPVVDFTADVRIGYAPFTVQFTSLSTNTPKAWAWDFDNDGTAESAAKNPTFTYTEPGNYTVKLTATNAAGSGAGVKTDYIIVLLAPVAAPWENFHGNDALTGYSGGTAPHTGNIKWMSDVNAVSSSTVAIGEGKAFVLCAGGDDDFSANWGAMTAVDLGTGAILWTTNVTKPDWGSWSSPCYDDGMVFESSGMNTVALYASNGTIAWTFTNPTGTSSCNGGPMVANGKVYCGDWDGHYYYCLDRETGAILWSINVGGYAQGTPAYHNGKVFLTSWAYPAGNLYCVNAETGALLWHSNISLDMCGSPSISDDGLVYVTTYGFYSDGNIYCYYEANGTEKWSQVIQRTDSTPCIAYGNVYVTGGCSGYSPHQTYCFDAVTGTPKWSTTIDQDIGGWTNSVAAADGLVFVGQESTGSFFGYQAVYALDAYSGSVVWSNDYGGATPALFNGMMLTTAYDGRLLAFKDLLPAADFLADVTSGLAPLSVHFSDLSSDATAWQWDFDGDGVADSDERNASYTYNMPGTYTVKLTVSNAGGSDTEIKTGYVTVYATPAISVSPSAVSVSAGASRTYAIIVDNLQYGLSGYALNITLDHPETGEIVDVSYPVWASLNKTLGQPGDTIRISAMDMNRSVEAGATGVVLATITVRGDQPGTTSLVPGSVDMDYDGGQPVTPATNNGRLDVYIGLTAEFSAAPLEGQKPLAVQFTDLTTGTPGVESWLWTFGDGNTSTMQNPSHTYAVPGTYTVTLTVTNQYSTNTATKTGLVTVKPRVEPFPGHSTPPTDVDGDGLYEDINGNGRLDFDDIVVLYQEKLE